MFFPQLVRENTAFIRSVGRASYLVSIGIASFCKDNVLQEGQNVR